MAMTGFNPDQVTSSMNNVEKAYSDLIKALGTDVQSNFINAMANAWACNQAQSFFTDNFKPAIDELLNSAFNTFKSVIESMNSAASGWAQQTESSWSTKSFGGELRKVDVSSIKENLNGVRGVDESQANNIASKLASIAQAAISALSAAQSAVNNCGFVGRDQAQTLISSLGTIKTNISNATEQLTNATKTAVNNTVEAYGTLATNVESAFTAQ